MEEMTMERTFVMIKPDAVQRGLVGEIIKRFEQKGLKIVGLKMIQMDRDLAEQLYDIHKGKPFFEPLIQYITSAPVVTLVLEGENAVNIVRKIIGATNAAEANPGTIRGDFALTIGRNVVHASDAPERAQYELSLFFSEKDLCNWKRIDQDWLYE